MLNRRQLIGGGVSLTALSVLAGCGTDEKSAPSAPKEGDEVKGSVLHWTYPMNDTAEESWWAALVADFNKKYPNVEVQVVVQPWKGRNESLNTAITSKTGPDTCYMIPDFMGKFAEEGLLTDLSNVIEPSRDDFVESTLKSWTVEGKIMAMPQLVEVATPGYNSELTQDLGFDKAPETWEDLEALAKAATAKGLTAFDYAAADGSLNGTFYPFLWQAGGDVLSEDGKSVRINDEAGVQALTFLRKLVDMKALNPETLTSPMPTMEQSLFALGKQPYNLMLQVVEARELMGDKVKACTPLTGKQKATFGTVGGLVAFESAKHPDAVAAWLNFMGKPETNEKFVKAAGFLSPRKSLQDIWADDEDMTYRSQFMEDIRVGVLHPKSREMMDAISPHLQACLLGKKEPKAALDEAASQISSMIGA